MPQIIPIKNLKNTAEIPAQQIRGGKTKDARKSLLCMQEKYGL